jgi:hypothetical protein
MKVSTITPTKDQQQRFRRIREIGCIACRQTFGGFRMPEIHHLTVTGKHGGKRLGHDATVGLCDWHHRGVLPTGLDSEEAQHALGPSLARTPRQFRMQYGQDAVLLGEQERQLLLAYG